MINPVCYISYPGRIWSSFLSLTRYKVCCQPNYNSHLSSAFEESLSLRLIVVCLTISFADVDMQNWTEPTFLKSRVTGWHLAQCPFGIICNQLLIVSLIPYSEVVHHGLRVKYELVNSNRKGWRDNEWSWIPLSYHTQKLTWNGL